MKNSVDVLLITGPAGSGKSTLAQYAASRPGWVQLSEDDYWVKHGWGSGLRTSEQEEVIQQEVMKVVISQTKEGNKVALEFILYYPTKPNPLSNYQQGLSELGISVQTVALKPSVDEILRRLKERGRRSDIDNLEAKRKDAEHQVACLEANYIAKDWLVDPTGVPVENLFASIIK